MTSARHYKTKATEKSEYTIFLQKANEFFRTMYQAEKAENWNAVGLTGVHTVISLIDALLVKHCGIRSSDESHMTVVDLLTSSVGNKLKDVAQKSQTARRIIAKKNIVAYENRNFIKSEAIDLIKKVDRFYRWAINQL
ncbi:MAG: hypothetical protein KKH94_00920 [Candidatus Omnitrophica bacterium]|nr:hypothetical protein [Candidatus Omnitrophota bacterium]